MSKYRRHICGPLLIGTKKQRIAYTVTGEVPKGCRLEAMLGHIKVSDLTTAQIRQWHKRLSEEVGVYSANRAKQQLETILAIAAEDFNVKPPMMPKQLGRGPSREKKLILNAEQVQILMQHAEQDPYGIYYTFPFLTGTRISEQLGLLWSEVDFEKRLIRIRRTLDRSEGLVETTKTAAGRREFHMSDYLYNKLLAWRDLCSCDTNYIRCWT